MYCSSLMAKLAGFFSDPLCISRTNPLLLPKILLDSFCFNISFGVRHEDTSREEADTRRCLLY